MNLQVSDEAEVGRSIVPEIRLFRHIILNAVLDAIYGSCLTNENSDQIRADALRWFAQAGPDFETICECADLHPETVRKDALNYISAMRETLPSKTRRPRLHSLKTSNRKAA